jgi:hypothetical protein
MSMTADVHSLDTQRLFREVQALRADVAMLRREVAAMRSAAVADTVDLFVRAFQQLPQGVLNRQRGFRKLP